MASIQGFPEQMDGPGPADRYAMPRCPYCGEDIDLSEDSWTPWVMEVLDNGLEQWTRSHVTPCCEGTLTEYDY